MSRHYSSGMKITCTKCKDYHNLYTPDYKKEAATMLMYLIVADHRIYQVIPGPDSPLGKSECCQAPLEGELFGY